MNKERTLITGQELDLLFPNQVQRDIFIKVITVIIDIISERTVNVPFVNLHENS